MEEHLVLGVTDHILGVRVHQFLLEASDPPRARVVVPEEAGDEALGGRGNAEPALIERTATAGRGEVGSLARALPRLLREVILGERDELTSLFGDEERRRRCAVVRRGTDDGDGSEGGCRSEDDERYCEEEGGAGHVVVFQVRGNNIVRGG